MTIIKGFINIACNVNKVQRNGIMFSKLLNEIGHFSACCIIRPSIVSSDVFAVAACRFVISSLTQFHSTLCPKKVSPLMFDNNFGKNVDRFSKFFQQLIRMKIPYVYTTKIFISRAVCCYPTL